MADVSAKVIGQDRLNRRLQAIRSRAVSPRQPLEEIGGLMVRSVRRNFREGGRPKKWPKSQRAGERRSTLVKDEHLMRSVHAKVEATRVLIGPHREYARIHQYGSKGLRGGVIKQTPTAKQRKYFWAMYYKHGHDPKWKASAMSKQIRIKIPARPYLVFQKEDRRRAARIYTDWALRGK